MNDHDQDQCAFTDLLEEMEATEQAQLDGHRTKVQAFFDAMTPQQQEWLGDWMYHREWLTCQALSAAACDWYHSQPAQIQIARMRAGLEAACKPPKRAGGAGA